MNRVAAMAAVVGLCLVGVLIGALAVHIYYVHHGPSKGDRPWGPPRGLTQGLDHLERELELTATQREQVRQILDEALHNADALRAEMLPRLHEQMDETRERLRAVLTPEQLARFERMHREQPHLAERFLLGHDPEGGHRPPHP